MFLVVGYPTTRKDQKGPGRTRRASQRYQQRHHHKARKKKPEIVEIFDKETAIRRINELSNSKVPFLLIADYSLHRNHVIPLDEIDPEEVLYYVSGRTNSMNQNLSGKPISLTVDPPHFEEYLDSFNKVHQHLSTGNTYLVNLTYSSTIKNDLNLLDIFHQSKAAFKLWFRDRFVVFSPERFIRIKDGVIHSHPMKGTIDSDIPDAENALLGNQKEIAEHTTIVDLIRNDMSILANDVVVEDFMYLDRIRTNRKNLLQSSTHIKGILRDDYLSELGDIIYSLLPAGSITGAPKPSTLEIISQIESHDRGYYTGIVGLFDGSAFDSGVMIRFIEQDGNRFVYKSGGGIHYLSDPEKEYNELIDKIYVPIL